MREYMERLRGRGELLVSDRPVEARHELAAVTEKVQKTSNRPILFTNVSGSALPVLTNIYGSRERLAEILAIEPAQFCRKWSELATTGAGGAGPLQVEADPPAGLIEGKLSELPLLTYSAKDGGPYFTSALFLANDPETGVGNLSFHRSM